MDTLNQHPKIHLRGENHGLFNVFKEKINKVQWQSDYREAVQEKKWHDATHFNILSKDEAYKGVGLMFKHLYGHDDNADKIVGFKEIRHNNHWNEIHFLKELCQSSKIIFHYSPNIEKISKKKWYKKTQNVIEHFNNSISLFHEYNQKFPNDTFISTTDDFKKPGYVNNLFKFIGLSLEGIDIDVDRLYKADLERHNHQ